MLKKPLICDYGSTLVDLDWDCADMHDGHWLSFGFLPFTGKIDFFPNQTT